MATTTAARSASRNIDSSNLGYQCSARGNKECEPDVGLRQGARQAHRQPHPAGLCDLPAGQEGRAAGPLPHVRRRGQAACLPGVPHRAVDRLRGHQNPMIGLVGSKGAGKTVLMTVLVQQLREQSSRALRRGHQDRHRQPGRPAGHHRLPQTSERIRSSTTGANCQRRPTATAAACGRTPRRSCCAGGRRNPPCWPSSTARARTSATRLDPHAPLPGGLRVPDRHPRPVLAARARATGSTCPRRRCKSTTTSRSTSCNITAMLRTYRKVRTNKKIQIPVAIVFTKIDAFFPTMDEGNPIMATAPAVPSYDEADGLAVHEQMRALLKEWDAGAIETHLSAELRGLPVLRGVRARCRARLRQRTGGRRRGTAAPG